MKMKNKTYSNLQDAGRAVPRGKFITVSAFIKKEEWSQINNLNFHLKKLEKMSKLNPKQAESSM